MKIEWQPGSVYGMETTEIRGLEFSRFKRGSKFVYFHQGVEYPTMTAAWVSTLEKKS